MRYKIIIWDKPADGSETWALQAEEEFEVAVLAVHRFKQIAKGAFSDVNHIKVEMQDTEKSPKTMAKLEVLHSW